MKNFYQWSILCLIAALLAGCAKHITTSRTSEVFEEFYDRFHADERFQLDRVKFPLAGEYEGPEGSQPWVKSAWEPHKQKVSEISDPQYITDIVKTEGEVIEKVQEDGGGFYSERRFQLIDGKWYLVFYDTVNL